MNLFATIRDFCLQSGLEKTFLIAYSGGLDSHVLLSLMSSLRKDFPLKFRAIHINHGLSAHAKDWETHCTEICKTYGVDLLIRAIQVDYHVGDSLENAARDERYTIFAECLGEGEILLTAHHQDDQAETLLLQLLRGAGPKGLAAMPSIKAFACGFHGRPFLSFPRHVLHSYANLKKLKWIEDESNRNIKLTRNFIRHEILPILKTRWPTVTHTLSRSAKHSAEAEMLLNEFALELCAKTQGSHQDTLSVTKLLRWSPEKQRLILRSWIKQLNYPLPNTRKIEAIQHQMQTASLDRMPCVHWQNVEVRRYRDDLFALISLPPHIQHQTFLWNLLKPLTLPGIGLLHAQAVQGHGLRADIKQVCVQFRQGGEMAHISKRGHHPLKKLFQEWGALPWERDRIPLIFLDNILIGVVGYFLDDKMIAKNSELGWKISLI